MHAIDWSITATFLLAFIGVALWCRRYVKSVADYLAANRCAGRYVLCVADGMAGLGAISIIAMFEMFYSAGFTANWWGQLSAPISLLMALSGWVVYRYRETRALTLGQFFEMRYSRNLRIFTGIVGWLAGIINFGIFPAVGTRFFIYYCKLPPELPVFGGVSTYATLMALLLVISLFFVFMGGQVTVMITDFLQASFTNIVLMVILFLFLWKFDWSTITETLGQRPEGQSMLNPFQTQETRGFNFFFFIIGALGAIYGFRAWQGNQGFNASAKSPHEAKMAGILGEWRGLVLGMVMLFIPVGAYIVMHNGAYLEQAAQVQTALGQIENATVQNQMTVPLVLTSILPPGLIGLFCAVVLAAFISTHDTYMHSWGSIFIQDVVLPIRGKPFPPKQHLWCLRLSIAFVALFIYIFSLLFEQNEYILMFFSITGAIYIAGAGSLIIGGLYWKHGSTLGAWGAMIIGSSCSILSIVLRQLWVPYIYPWMESNSQQLLALMTRMIEGVSSIVPGINWVVTAEEFPIESQWMFFFVIVLSLAAYVGLSLFETLVRMRPACDLDQLLHRGEWAESVPDTTAKVPVPVGWKAMLPSGEFSRGDRFIYYLKLSWSLFWMLVFVVGTGVNLFYPFSDTFWSGYWRVYTIIITVVGSLTCLWFLTGGISDMRQLFKTLATAKRDASDGGFVDKPVTATSAHETDHSHSDTSVGPQSH